MRGGGGESRFPVSLIQNDFLVTGVMTRVAGKINEMLQCGGPPCYRGEGGEGME